MNCLFIQILVIVSYARSVVSVVNNDVQRAIDASTSILKIYIDIKASDVGKEYDLSFPTSEAQHLAYLAVTRKGKPLVIKAPVE